MKRTVFASLFVFFLCAIGANAQSQRLEIANGSPGDLKGVRKVSIVANENDKKAIVAVINRKLPQLTIVATPEAAEVWIVFRVRNANSPANSAGSAFDSSGPTTAVDYEIAASGEVLKPVSAGRARSLVEFNDSRRFSYETDMAARFARVFVEAYRKAN